MSTSDTVNYYPGLLILQYVNQPRASATVKTTVTPFIMPQVTVETISFSPVPDSGAFILSYGSSEITVNWDASAASIQAQLRGLSGVTVDGGGPFTVSSPSIDGGDPTSVVFNFDLDGGGPTGFDLSEVTVTGSIASGLLTITFVGVTPPADLLALVSSTLMSGMTSVTVGVEETDLTLPLAVQSGYNLTGDSTAVGLQLDVVGKYVGASRTGNGFTEQVTLDDADYLTLIKLSVIENSAGSSLAEIQQLIFDAFGSTVVLYDYADMFMAYYISSDIASTNLLQLFVTEGKLPKPMGVGVIIVVFDAANAFGFEGSTNSGGFGDLGDASVGGEFASLYPP